MRYRLLVDLKCRLPYCEEVWATKGDDCSVKVRVWIVIAIEKKFSLVILLDNKSKSESQFVASLILLFISIIYGH